MPRNYDTDDLFNRISDLCPDNQTGIVEETLQYGCQINENNVLYSILKKEKFDSMYEDKKCRLLSETSGDHKEDDDPAKKPTN